jgi:nucleoside-diphosphate-sugar epimerase
LTAACGSFTIKGMKVLITGGTGFIGSLLADYLLYEKKAKIYALVRDINNLKWLNDRNIQFIEGTLHSFPSLPSDIEYVFHIAGCTKTHKLANYYTVNCQGTASLFQALINQKLSPKKIILLSSIAAGGPSKIGEALKEDGSPNPITPYGKSKLHGETEALKHKDKFQIVILRVGAVLGPRDRDFLPFFRLIQKRIFLSFAKESSRFPLCYVKDLIRALYLCTQKNLDNGEIINIANAKHYNWIELGQAIGKALGKKPLRINVPMFLAYPTTSLFHFMSKIIRKPTVINLYKLKDTRQESWIIDTNKAAEKLSFTPEYTIEEAIRETVDWYKQNNWI